MRTTRMFTLVAVVISLMFVSGLPWAVIAADKFPSRPITMIVPWSAGGGTDRIARMLAVGLEKELGQSVNVVNRPGGGGTVGHLAGATAKADGHTVTLATVEFTTYKKMGLANISSKDFVSIALVNLDPMTIGVSTKSPYKSIEELNKSISSNPGQLKASGAGHAGINDLARVGWLAAMNLPENALPWIPSPGGSAPAIQELVAGGVDVVITTAAEFAPMIDAGRVRLLATMGENRNPRFPDVKTLREIGLDWVMGTWRALLVPAGTPKHAIDVLREATKKVVASSEFKEFMSTSGFEILYKDGPECDKFVASQEASLSELLGLLGGGK